MQVNDEKPYDDINITPMLDLAYVLLVIFILMTTATVQGKRALLPRASNTPPPPTKEKPKLKVVTVNNDGSLLLGKDPVKIEDLAGHLRQHKAQHPDFPLLIRGDSQTPYQVVMDVLDIASSLKIKQISLPTKPKA